MLDTILSWKATIGPFEVLSLAVSYFFLYKAGWYGGARVATQHHLELMSAMLDSLKEEVAKRRHILEQAEKEKACSTSH